MGSYRSSDAEGSGGDGVAGWDVNEGGHPDLVVANLGSHDVTVLLGNGDGTFQAQLRFAVASGPSAVAVTDVNGDGYSDLVVTNFGSHDVAVLLGNGDGT